jgi:NAD(P)-dependent dehydrogenase (short-subunit alcohol dehydrogenase family)
VTGGASGIGAAVVSVLHAGGWRTAVLDIRGGDIPCDVSDEAQVIDAVGQVVAEHGRLDAAVLSAGIGGMTPLLDMTAGEWDRVLNVNLRGTFLCLRECARAMQPTGGSIVAVSSISGSLADRSTGHYNVSKAGVDMLVRVAARELGPHHIRVNAVAPGTTDTPLFAPTRHLPGYQEKVAARAALGRVGSTADVAAAIVALLDLEWVTGQVLAADGGLSLFSPIDIDG